MLRLLRLLFFAGGLFILIGGVLLFTGSTQVVSAVGNGMSIAGLLVGYIPIFFSIKKPHIQNPSQNDQAPPNIQNLSQNDQPPHRIPSYTITNSSISALLKDLTKQDQIFFLICLISIPIFTFIKLLNFTDIPNLLLTIVALSALTGVGLTSLAFTIDSRKLIANIFDDDSENALGGCYSAILLIILIGVVFPILFLTVGPNEVTLTCFLLACIFLFFIPYQFFAILSNEVFVKLLIITVLIFADLLFLVLASDPHFFMTVNPNGTFNVRSFSLLVPRTDLVFLTATIFLTFGVVGICASTKAILGSICGGTVFVIGGALLLYQTTPMFVAVSIGNMIMGLIMFVVARTR